MSATILIIEDEISIIKTMQFKFEISGFKVIYSLDGAGGVKMAREQSPDLIILDIMMPLMNGYEVLTDLKRDEKTSGIPVLMVTARVQDDNMKKAIDMGAVGYIYKPFSPKALLETVMKHIDV